MHAKIPANPQIPCNLNTTDAEGEIEYFHTEVLMVAVDKSKGGATARIEVRPFSDEQDKILVIELDLSELVAAISLATLHAEQA